MSTQCAQGRDHTANAPRTGLELVGNADAATAAPTTPARKFDGGSLVNSVGIEAFAAVLLTINLRHKGRASLRLGVEPRPPSFP